MNPLNPGLYSGPYVISELKFGSHIIFTPNPHFYGTKPNIKKIVVKLIPNTGTMEAFLRSGEIDVIASLGISFDQAVEIEKKVKAEKLPLVVIFQDGTTYEHIDFNLDQEILKDIRMRKALSHAINKKEITDSLFAGKQKPALHDRSPIDSAYTDDPKKVFLYKYDKKMARQLLDEMGWVPGKDGVREKNGQRLRIAFATTAGDKTREQVQALLQSYWKDVGVEVEIKNELARVFFGETLKQRKFQGMAMFAWSTVPELGLRVIHHSSAIPTLENNWSGSNRMGWKNSKVDSLYDQFDGEFNRNKRRKILQEIMKEYTRDIPVIPMYYRADVAVRPANLEGFEVTGTAFYETYNAEKWNVKKAD